MTNPEYNSELVIRSDKVKYITRSIEDILEKSSKIFKALLVTGACQTGKLTLLKEKFPDVSLVTFDDPFMEEQAKENPEMYNSNVDWTMFYSSYIKTYLERDVRKLAAV